MTLLLLPSVTDARGFLHGHGGPANPLINEEDFRAAMGEVLGCGNGHERDRFPHIQRILEPIWNTMPKDPRGRVEWKQLRYIAHRYFMQQSSLLIRGFETTKQVNNTHLGHAEILNRHVPSLVDATMNNHNNLGYLLEDAVTMVATLEQLVFDSETERLQQSFKHLKKKFNQTLSHAEMVHLMEVYMLHWMLSEDQEFLKDVLRQPALMQESLPAWPAVQQMLQGMVKSMVFKRQVSPQPGHARVAWERRYDSQDAHEIAGAITTSFASYWEVECQNIKKDLVKLDRTGSGRVRLSDFYGSNSDGEWRFGESEAYLRDLGALDESTAQGPQVIIPNYLQAASNCIVTTQHYLVCCVNECEDILGEVEKTIGEPTATPEQIIDIVQNMTDFDDNQPNLDGALSTQLKQIGAIHGGKVPLHGRLFAQWLHYTFPRECPFPHKTGTITQQTTVERGNDMLASKDEVQRYAAGRTTEDEPIMTVNDDLTAQWSDDEELVGDFSQHLRAPWERSHYMAMLSVIMMGIFIVYFGITKNAGGKSMSILTGNDISERTHYV